MSSIKSSLKSIVTQIAGMKAAVALGLASAAAVVAVSGTALTHANEAASRHIAERAAVIGIANGDDLGRRFGDGHIGQAFAAGVGTLHSIATTSPLALVRDGGYGDGVSKVLIGGPIALAGLAGSRLAEEAPAGSATAWLGNAIKTSSDVLQRGPLYTALEAARKGMEAWSADRKHEGVNPWLVERAATSEILDASVTVTGSASLDGLGVRLVNERFLAKASPRRLAVETERMTLELADKLTAIRRLERLGLDESYDAHDAYGIVMDGMFRFGEADPDMVERARELVGGRLYVAEILDTEAKNALLAVTSEYARIGGRLPARLTAGHAMVGMAKVEEMGEALNGPAHEAIGLGR